MGSALEIKPNVEWLRNPDTGLIVGFRDERGVERVNDFASALLASGGVAYGNLSALGGDSITEQCRGPGTANPRVRSNFGYFTYLNARLRGSLKMVANYGVSGQTMTTMLDRIRSGDINLDGIKYFFWIPSGNDINQGVITNAAQLREVITNIVIELRKRVPVVIAGNIMPRTVTNSAGFDTPAERALVAQGNMHLSDLSSLVPGFRSVDLFTRLVEPSTGAPLTGVMWDTNPVHPGATGAELIAECFYEGASDILPNGGYQITNNNYGGELVAVAPASWAISEAVGTWTTKTLTHGELGSDGKSDWSKLILATPSLPDTTYQLLVDTIAIGASTFAVGDTVQGAVEYEIVSAVDMKAVNMQLTINGAGQNVDTMGEFALPATGSGLNVSTTRPLNRRLFTTPEYVIPSGTTAMQPKLRFMANSASSALTVLIKNRPSLKNLSALRL